MELERVRGVIIARPHGDIDAANAAEVNAQLADGLEDNGDSLVLDLSETRYVDSAGLDMLLRLAERLRERRAALLLVIPERSQLSRLVAIVGLTEAWSIHQTVSQALASCAPNERLVQGRGEQAGEERDRG